MHGALDSAASTAKTKQNRMKNTTLFREGMGVGSEIPRK
jgi:hypothetical protein